MPVLSTLQNYFTTGANLVWRRNRVMGLPQHLQVEVTTFCNMNCLSCGRSKIIDKPRHMKLEELKAIYDRVRPRNINLSGLGEPLLNPAIFEMIRYCKQNGSIVNFPTNLNVSSNLIAKLMKAGPQQIKVSIDSASPETYRTVRRANTFETVVDNIRLLNSLKRERNLHHPEIRFNFALQRSNLDDLPRLFSLASDLGVRTVYVQDLNYYSVEDEKRDLCGIGAGDLKRVLVCCAKMAHRNGIHTNIDNWERHFNCFYNKMLPREQFEPNSISCLFPWVSAFIDVNGNVKPCPVFVWQKDSVSLGNCFETHFQQIWNGDRYLHLRQSVKKGERASSICQRCVPPSIFDMRLIFHKMLLRK